jgi:lipopolysaccharide biosynthesis glycosyltransferase
MGEDATTFLRICLHDLFPDLSRIIYLDADILVRHDITRLWEIDLEGKPLGAVVESPFSTAANRIESMSEIFAKHFKGPYFNGGVLMMDLDMWRKNDYAQKVLDFNERLEKEGDIYKLGDQSPLNLAFQNNWRHLPPSWNFSPYVDPTFSRGHKLAMIDHKTYLNIHQDPAIVHFLGSFKPWDIKDDKADVFVREYLAYTNIINQLL